ncbi:tyrosine--tRNA ligase [Candidatus Peregrinibacteria bacterium]|nr:tyrosine--tRNA ligase [Candidatus Peregrinibacteria bacterium]
MHKIEAEDPLFRVIDKVVPGDKAVALDLLNAELPQRIKFGTDPTGKDLHFGHAVNLWAMRRMQELGHKVDLVIGDVTASIGDPTGRKTERPTLTTAEVDGNAEHFLAQISRILLTTPDVFEVHRNSTWFSAMSAIDFINGTLRHTTIGKLLERKDFQERMAGNVPIHAHELAYQLLQGYDSVHLQTDIAVCGDDQLTNELMGRHLQERHGMQPQVLFTTRLTPGIDGGEKQSKSRGNYIGLTHSASEQFRRIMSIPDNLIEVYFEVYTDMPTDQIRASIAANLGASPRDLKMALARAMLSRYHSDEVIGSARENYERAALKQAPGDAPSVIVASPSVDLMQFAVDHLELSKSAFARLVAGGAVVLNGTKLDASMLKDRSLPVEISGGRAELKYGKNKWIVLTVEQG